MALGPAGRSALSERSESFEHFMPREFVRKPRGLDELDRWKAVEFRTFLLYTGPVALKSIAAEEVYCHFIAFHCAISLLVHKRLYYLQNGYAKSLLESVVQEFSRLYGAEQVSHNVHCLLHLADDALCHGPLDSFSAFPFENNMKQIKKMLRKHEDPLLQLWNRKEENKQQTSNSPVRVLPPYQFGKSHSSGPMLQECCPPQHYMVKMPMFTLAVNKADGCCFVGDDVVQILNIAFLESGEPCIIGQKYKFKENLYELPVESSRFGICIVSDISTLLQAWPLKDARKAVRLPYCGRFAVFPIIHAI